MAATITKTVTFRLPEGAAEKVSGSREDGVDALPKTPHPRLLQSPPPQQTASPEPHTSTSRPQTVPCGLVRRDAAQESAEARPHSRPSSDQSTFSPHDKHKKTIISQTSTSRRRQFTDDAARPRLGKPSDVDAAVVNAARERTNSASRENTRSLKYGVARLRESLLGVEEEVKRMTRGRRALELAVQDVRRAISVNQQSVSVQQKKTRAQTVRDFTNDHSENLPRSVLL